MKSVVYACLLLLSVWLIASAWTDLDWIIVANHFDMWNAEKDAWEFCPYLTMNWWLAYQYTVLRLIAGAVLLGGLVMAYANQKIEMAKN